MNTELLARRLGKPWHYLLNRIEQPAIVLIYHRVRELDLDPQQLAVHPEHFAQQLDYLKQTCRPLQVDAFSRSLQERRKFPPRSVLITFDDGYADNAQEALPLLEARQLQALFYISTSRLDTLQEMWWDELERMLLGPQTKPSSLSYQWKGSPQRVDTSTEKKVWDLYFSLQRRLRFAHPDEIDAVLEQLRLWSGLPKEGRESHRMMNLEELGRMAASPAAVLGCHTHRHPALGMLSPDQQRSEILESRTRLETLLKRPVIHFSYPFGSLKHWGPQRYYTRETQRLCRELDFEMVCANHYGQVHSWTNRMALPRILVRDWTREEFARHLETFFNA